MKAADLDHVGFAVADAAQTLRSLYRQGILIPVAGEEDDEFRYVVGLRSGGDRGVRVELLDPNGDRGGFLARYLHSHGVGAHHVTFMVDELDRTLRDLSSAGIPLTQVDLSYPPWREIFVHPRGGLGTVIQIASSVYTYPSSRSPALVDGTEVPHRRTGRNRDWWHPVVDDTHEPKPIAIDSISLGVEDFDTARTLFCGILGGRETATDQVTHARYEWSNGSINVSTIESPGIISLHFAHQSHSLPTEFAIGRTRFVEGSRDDRP